MVWNLTFLFFFCNGNVFVYAFLFFFSRLHDACLILFEVFLTSFFFFGFYKKKQAQESFFLFDQLIGFYSAILFLSYSMFTVFFFCLLMKTNFFFCLLVKSLTFFWEREKTALDGSKIWWITKEYLIKVLKKKRRHKKVRLRWKKKLFNFFHEKQFWWKTTTMKMLKTLLVELLWKF